MVGLIHHNYGMRRKRGISIFWLPFLPLLIAIGVAIRAFIKFFPEKPRFT